MLYVYSKGRANFFGVILSLRSSLATLEILMGRGLLVSHPILWTKRHLCRESPVIGRCGDFLSDFPRSHKLSVSGKSPVQSFVSERA